MKIEFFDDDYGLNESYIMIGPDLWDCYIEDEKYDQYFTVDVFNLIRSLFAPAA